MAVRRARAAYVALFATILLLGLVPASPAFGREPEGIDRFMQAVGQVESGGRYAARNRWSGAFGKYQIMPASWRGWARIYLGNANAPRTRKNQEIVARGKMTALHLWLGDWRRVAHWWLTGSSRNEALWSASARRYVAKVMKAYRTGPAVPPEPVPAEPPVVVGSRSFQETDAAVAYTGAWREAPYPDYAGRSARWTDGIGATATFTFTGRTVAWFGPSGPTRGTASVFVDGQFVRTVDLYALHFRPRTRIFATEFAEAGPHALGIEVLATKGRSTVAIDQFVVTD
ncbi:MAG: transglycosylase family protein [Chloroflexota bacterium]|nr:transglycosylase family protein [Chloroflexota bacterium]